MPHAHHGFKVAADKQRRAAPGLAAGRPAAALLPGASRVTGCGQEVMRRLGPALALQHLLLTVQDGAVLVRRAANVHQPRRQHAAGRRERKPWVRRGGAGAGDRREWPLVRIMQPGAAQPAGGTRAVGVACPAPLAPGVHALPQQADGRRGRCGDELEGQVAVAGAGGRGVDGEQLAGAVLVAIVNPAIQVEGRQALILASRRVGKPKACVAHPPVATSAPALRCGPQHGAAWPARHAHHWRGVAMCKRPCLAVHGGMNWRVPSMLSLLFR